MQKPNHSISTFIRIFKVTVVIGIWGILTASITFLGACDAVKDDTTIGKSSSAARQSELPRGDSHCPDGGVKVDMGIDEDGDGELDNREIDHTEYVCNGASGEPGNDGQNGLNALINVTDLSPGDICMYGGLKLDVGMDTNANGKLDSNEITGTHYVCGGILPYTTTTTTTTVTTTAGNCYTPCGTPDSCGTVTTTTSTSVSTTTTLPSAKAGNVFLDSLGGVFASKHYKFLHGSTSPDGTKMFVIVNNAATPQGTTDGTNTAYILDATALTQGTVTSLVGPVTITGGAGTISFRSNWSADGTKILLAGADRFFVLNSSTLVPLNGTNGITDMFNGAGTIKENHDAIASTDGKYALLALRTKPHAAPDETKRDGMIQLYDMTTNAKLGNSVSVCNACHGSWLGVNKDSTLCGIDGKVEKVGTTYTGTVYVAGHGGHIVKVPVTIDPTNTTNPITVGTLGKLTVTSAKFAAGETAADAGLNTSTHKLHDVRVDGTTIYWSTYNLDKNLKLHRGKIKTDGTGVTDTAVDVDARATKPAAAVNAMPYYCASGQTPKAHMPMTMTNEAYITVIPKQVTTGLTPCGTPY